MPRVHFVKKARKDNPVCKRGESYYWWKFRYGGMRFSLTRPKPSQLTQSDFLSWAYGVFDTTIPGVRIENLSDAQSIITDLTGEAEEYRDTASDSLENMPYQLQDGEVGSKLQERVDWCDEFINELECIDLSDLEDMDSEVKIREANGEPIPEQFWERYRVRIDEFLDELKSLSEYGGG